MNKLFIALVALAMNLNAWSTPMKVDPSKSKVGFSIFKFKIGKPVAGEFKKFTGTFDVDAKTKLLTSANGDIVAESIDTDSGKRNKHLRSADFFDVANYPNITFKLTKHTGSLKDGTITGFLTMKKIEKPITLKAVVTNADPKNYAITLKGKINRKDFNITWNDVLDKGGFVLADEVDLELNIQGAEVAQEAI
ncbi:MAG: YceI family protein [Bdellovibrionota bacterium]